MCERSTVAAARAEISIDAHRIGCADCRARRICRRGLVLGAAWNDAATGSGALCGVCGWPIADHTPAQVAACEAEFNA